MRPPSPLISPQHDRAAARAALAAQHADAARAASAAWSAWDQRPLDPAHQMNYDAFREQCSRLTLQMTALQEIES